MVFGFSYRTSVRSDLASKEIVKVAVGCWIALRILAHIEAVVLDKGRNLAGRFWIIKISALFQCLGLEEMMNGVKFNNLRHGEYEKCARNKSMV